ncbi:MAG: TolC family protein [Ignavibacteriae bacterium]|nr:TolC family protein [Ignavibacteriota bacterium]
MKHYPNFLLQENLRMNRIVLLLLFVALAASVVTAQTTLTLDKAVKLVTERNTVVVQARNTLDAKRSAVQAAYGNLFPTVGISGDYSTSRTKSTFYNGIQLGTSSDVQTNSQYSTGVGANVTLFDGFANTSGIELAEQQEGASLQDLNQSEKNAIYRTHLLFLDVFRKYQLLKVSEDNLKRSQQQLTRISEANKVGSVALADVYRQRVQVGSDELAVIQSQNDFDNTKADLLAYLAVDNPTEYTVDFAGIATDVDANEFQEVNAKYSNFDNLLKQAITNRPDYLSAVYSFNASEAGVTSAKASNYPTVSASASYGYSSSELSKLFDNNSLRFGLSLNYSLFNGFQTTSRIEQAQVGKRNAEEQLNQTKRQIQVELRKALLDLEAAQKQAVVTKTSVESAEMDHKIAQEKYNLGAGTLLDVLIAQANYTNALSNKVNAVIGYLLSKKQVEFALGTISQ